jgi:hypothetical protein
MKKFDQGNRRVNLSYKLSSRTDDLQDPDDGSGGDLILYRRKTLPNIDDTKWPAAEDIEEARRAPYQANTLVLLANSAWAVDGISPGKRSPYPRRFVNFVAQST